jgi:hypothetical protein
MERQRRWNLRAVGCPAFGFELASRWTRAASIALLVATAAGCGSFFGSPEPSGLGSNGIKNACTWKTVKEDCLDDEYCDAPDCNAVGSCVTRPSPFMTGELNWACGCDGVTYGNSAFARAQGVTTPTIGQCTGPSSGGGVTPAEPLSCSGTKKCPAGAVCLPLASSSCSGNSDGYCWAWPNDATCTPGAQTGYLLCSGSTTCMTECQAITSMQRYRMTTIGCR